MSAYILLYIIAMLLSVYLGFTVYQHYRQKSGLFFFLCTIFAALWCLGYFLILSGFINNEIIILYISRLSFFNSVAGIYSFLFFIIFFQDKEKNNYKNIMIILLVFLGLFLITIFTDLVIESIKFEKNIYKENYGIFYYFYIFLYIAYLPISLYFSNKQIQKQSNLNKLRLKKILYGSLTFVLIGVVFQIILPLFGLWFLKKELIFFFVFFMLSVVYTIQRYFFLDIGYGVGRVVIGAISILLSTLILYLINNYYLLNNLNNGYINKLYSPIDNIIGVIVFSLIYKILSIIFLGDILKTELKESIEKIQQKILYITDFKELNLILLDEMNKIFKTNFCEIILFQKEAQKKEIQKFFESKKSPDVFINDMAFIEENQGKFNKNEIIKSIPQKSFLVFPIYNSDKKNIGFFTLGTKIFGDFYNIDEINIIKRFIFFLEYHLKYIKNYERIKDLTINLDKEVDEKTIEYNNLINKQKEFINMISHEIRSPISSAVFQADSIIDDIDSGEFNLDKIKSELTILNNILIKTGDLSSKLFSVQYYDTHSITLYKEKIQIGNLLKSEIAIYSHINNGINFIYNIDENIGFVELDKIQFQQVIENILTNAIKFINKNGTIKIESYKDNSFFITTIEDNGKGFKGINLSQLFEKYSVGSGKYVGLGMGLYLCKKIINMHKGEIIAENSKELGGAKFVIKIPI